MLNIKSYDLFLESQFVSNMDVAMKGIEDVHRGQGTFDYSSKVPKGIMVSIPDNIKNEMRTWTSNEWYELGPIISKIDFLMDSYSIPFEGYLPEFKSTSSDLIIEGFSQALNKMLDDTVFKDVDKSKWQI